jgi:hypothetical protein
MGEGERRQVRREGEEWREGSRKEGEREREGDREREGVRERRSEGGRRGVRERGELDAASRRIEMVEGVVHGRSAYLLNRCVSIRAFFTVLSLTVPNAVKTLSTSTDTTH